MFFRFMDVSPSSRLQVDNLHFIQTGFFLKVIWLHLDQARLENKVFDIRSQEPELVPVLLLLSQTQLEKSGNF